MIRNIATKLRFKGKNNLIRFFFPKSLKTIIPYSKSLIYVDTFEHICWDLYWHGSYERDVVWVLDKFLIQDSVCVDVGANIGIYTILLAEKAKRVISFEPHPAFFERLKFNVFLNNFINVTLKQLGLSSKSGDAILFSPPATMQNKSATMCKLNDELTEEIKIQITTLDETIDEKIDFIKIDVDGSDAEVIFGAKRLIEKYRPIILFEYLKDYVVTKDSKSVNLGVDLHKRQMDAISNLENIGYVTKVVAKKYLAELNDSTKNFSNVILIPKEKYTWQ